MKRWDSFWKKFDSLFNDMESLTDEMGLSGNFQFMSTDDLEITIKNDSDVEIVGKIRSIKINGTTIIWETK
jgi:hypothetical protein